MATGTKKPTKRRQPDGDAREQVEVVEEQPRGCVDRPTHLASAVLASYAAQTGHVVGSPFEGAIIAGGACYEPRATCINGTEQRSLWRVQCYVEFDDPQTGLHRYLPRPTACVWVDDNGQITEVCKA